MNPSSRPCKLPTTSGPALPITICAIIKSPAAARSNPLTPLIIDFKLSIFIIVFVILLFFYLFTAIRKILVWFVITTTITTYGFWIT
jgi:hypothetical protein